MELNELSLIIEAALQANPEPLSVARLTQLFEEGAEPSTKDIKTAIGLLQERYLNSAMECVEVASGYRIQVNPKYNHWIKKLFSERPAHYSRALLETLALIVYRQPITRGEIEDVRGVAVSSNIIKTLFERGWVRVLGHRDVPGKPALLGTTKQFLDDFNIKKLSDLPPLDEIKSLRALGGAEGSEEEPSHEYTEEETQEETRGDHVSPQEKPTETEIQGDETPPQTQDNPLPEPDPETV